MESLSVLLSRMAITYSCGLHLLIQMKKMHSVKKLIEAETNSKQGSHNSLKTEKSGTDGVHYVY